MTIIIFFYVNIMSFLECTTSFVKNADGSSTFTITMDKVMTKCMSSLSSDPEIWIHNTVHNRSRIEGERIYKEEMERHLDAGTLPENSTKKSLIENYVIPEQTNTETY